MEIFAANREILIALLVKLGIIASLASLLTRSQTFRKTLFAEEREAAEKLTLIRFWGLPLCIGVVIRGAGVGTGTINPFAAFDLSLEGTFIAGLLGGTVVGAIVGGCVGVVALLQQAGVGGLGALPDLGALERPAAQPLAQEKKRSGTSLPSFSSTWFFRSSPGSSSARAAGNSSSFSAASAWRPCGSYWARH